MDGGDAEGVGVEGAVFFAGEVVCGLGGEFIEGAGEEPWGLGRGEAMAVHEVLDEEEAADGGDDGDEEDAYGVLALLEELLDECEAAGGLTGGEGVAELEDDAGAGEGDEGADVIDGGVAASGAEVEVDFFELVIDLAGVAAGEHGEELDGVGAEAEIEGAGAGVDEGAGGFLPAASTGVELVEELDVGEFGESFVEGAALIDIDGAEEEFYAGGEAFREGGLEAVEGVGDGGGAAEDCVGEEVCVFEPDEFVAAEEGEGEEGLAGLVDAGGGVVGVIGGTVDGIEVELAGVGACHFDGEG